MVAQTPIHLVQSLVLFSHSLPALAGHSIGSPCQLFELQTPLLRWRALAPALDRSLARNPRSSPIVSPSGFALHRDYDWCRHANLNPPLIGSLLTPPSLPLDQPANDRVLSDYGQNWRQPHSPRCRQCGVLEGFVAQTRWREREWKVFWSAWTFSRFSLLLYLVSVDLQLVYGKYYPHYSSYLNYQITKSDRSTNRFQPVLSNWNVWLYLSCSHFMMPFRKSLQLLDRCWLPCLPIPTITLTVPGLRFTPSQSVRSTSQIINQHTPWHLTFKTYHSRFKTQCLHRISWKRRNEIKQTLWALNIIQFNGNAIILRNEIVELSTV